MMVPEITRATKMIKAHFSKERIIGVAGSRSQRVYFPFQFLVLHFSTRGHVYDGFRVIDAILARGNCQPDELFVANLVIILGTGPGGGRSSHTEASLRRPD